MAIELKNWVPSKQPQLELGPARWNGTAIISDVAIEGTERLISIGLIERLILEKIDGRRSTDDIERSLQEAGLRLPDGKLFTTLNKFAFFGIIERPFAVQQGTGQIDTQSRQMPLTRDDQITSASQQRGILAFWKKLSWVTCPPTFTVLAALGPVVYIALNMTVPDALITIKNAQPVHIVMGLLTAILWSALVTLTHENAHAAAFNAYAKRKPYLALTRWGIILMPNTHMPGISLMQPKRKAAVITAGPLISMVLAAVPVSVFRGIETPGIHTVAAICVLIDAIIIGLGISFFPNTDATRILETISGTDQIQAVALRTLTHGYNLPFSLPGRTRVAVRAYPVLLLAATGIWLAATGWAIRLILN